MCSLHSGRIVLRGLFCRQQLELRFSSKVNLPNMKLHKSILLSAGIGLCRLWVVTFSLALLILMSCSHVQAAQITANADLIMKQKLHNIMIPEFTLSGAIFEEAVEQLRQLSQQLDTIESDPAKRGVNIVIQSDSDKVSHAINAVNTSEMKITLSLRDLPQTS